jgi:hypothetical protein
VWDKISERCGTSSTNLVNADEKKGKLMPLQPSPLNPDHGLLTRPRQEDCAAVQRWLSRRYGLNLSSEDVVAIIADTASGSALRHRLRWAYTHNRWTLKLCRHGRQEPQSQECVPLNGAKIYEWAQHVEGRRTPAPVYPGEPWNVDASFSHVVTSGPHAGVQWDTSVEAGVAQWAHERYGLPEQEMGDLRLTAHRKRGAHHRSIPQFITCELSPTARRAYELSLLSLSDDNVIVTTDGREVPVAFTPAPGDQSLLIE